MICIKPVRRRKSSDLTVVSVAFVVLYSLDLLLLLKKTHIVHTIKLFTVPYRPVCGEVETYTNISIACVSEYITGHRCYTMPLHSAWGAPASNPDAS